MTKLIFTNGEHYYAEQMLVGVLEARDDFTTLDWAYATFRPGAAIRMCRRPPVGDAL